MPDSEGNVFHTIRVFASKGRFIIKYTPETQSPGQTHSTFHYREEVAKRSRLLTIQHSTCMLNEMSRAFGHLVE